MENNKIVALNTANAADEDCFIRICNSKHQEARRKRLIQKERRARMLIRFTQDAAIVLMVLVILAALTKFV